MDARLARGTLIAALLLFAPLRAESAATFMIVNNDPAGVGFNDPTGVAPVGNNPGTTVGQQRLNAFQYAANLWGSRLTSGITINVAATFGALSCSPSSGVLGSAGPTGGFAFGGPFPNVPANTIVTVAEAEKLAGSNLNGTSAEISAQFNGNIGTPSCLTGLTWYYGFDSSPPPGSLDFVTVLLHELGHGLGFLTFVNTSTGAEASGLDDVFETRLADNSSGTTAWATMSNAQRMASAINTNHVVWTGPNVTGGTTASSGQDGSGRKLLFTPSPLEPGSSVSHWTQSSVGGSDCAACTDLQPIDLMRPSYTVPVHRTFITHLALTDIGWGTVTSPATTTVTTLADEDDGYIGGSTGVSLREAIKYSLPGDVIDFAVTGTITLSQGQLTIPRNLSIHGPAANTVTVSGNTASRVFFVNAGVTAEILNLEITSGRTVGVGAQGADIRNEGALRVGYCTIRNGNTDSDGGAFYSIGALTVDHSLIRDNHSAFDGAGLHCEGGTASFENCTFTGGTASVSGGALRNAGGASILVRNCTIAGNQAGLNGGGMGGAFTLQNTIVSGNTAGGSGPDVFAGITSAGYNLIGNSAGASGFGPNDYLDKNPNLGPLSNLGGPTLVLPITVSPAVNAVPVGVCAVSDDQRGVSRPLGGACDIGAYELDNLVDVPAIEALGFGIAPMWPNPAMRGSMIVRFALPNASAARLELFDVAGRRVASENVGTLGAGKHSVSFGVSRTLAPGLYLVRLTQGNNMQVTRVVVAN